MGNKRLFVMIDDDTDDHEIFKMAISDLNKSLDCLFFPDCESAISHFSNTSVTPPGYVFIDLSLPRINGDQCLQELQKLKEFDDPCIVIYSTSIPNEWYPKLEKIGVDRFMEKTFSVPTLTSQINHLIEAD
ncbi:response regulator [Dyadobacter aurulentus]|uniref:response regulator n=1 Tax=Dyadobacter sp. UC 10 TaxID=2605428 RepID=UPI0011F3B811|nr:response regulator [Dyadobacter sp. UC 10]KAA0991965.1 response regulator [Dyadobacter sp. UC 10]